MKRKLPGASLQFWHIILVLLVTMSGLVGLFLQHIQWGVMLVFVGAVMYTMYMYIFK